MGKVLYFFLMYTLFFLFLSTPAYAYLDPGTGSMLLQGLAAAFFGLLFFSKRIIASIKGFFSRDVSDSHNKDTEE